MHEKRGKRHNYLGIWIYYSILEGVRIYMEEYLRGVLDNFPEEITETPETPATVNLFNVRDDKKRELPDKKRS